MQKVHYLLQRFLGLVLTCHILKGNAGFSLYIDLCVALSNAHGASALGHFPKQKAQQHPH